jgi:hypothetical protein
MRRRFLPRTSATRIISPAGEAFHTSQANVCTTLYQDIKRYGNTDVSQLSLGSIPLITPEN